MASSSQRPRSLLVSTSSPARPVPSSSRLSPQQQSHSPFRYVHFPDQKRDPLSLPSSRTSFDHPLSHHHSSSGHVSPVLTPSSPLHTASAHFPPPLLPPPPPPPAPTQLGRGRPQGFRIPDSLQPWLGLGSWAATTLGFLLALAFWKDEVFAGLDQLALELQRRGSQGHAILFCLIFITTIPPFPLYSTLIVLSGYAFGTWPGALISYTAALSGALAVFLLSRRLLRAHLARLLARTRTLQRAVRAIERRPALLLLIRIAPYPYNLMNVLLAASHTLAFRTYAACTALSLAKVVVHTSLGASLHSFAGGGGGGGGGAARAWTAGGIVLCVGLFVYLAWVARRAVDEELGDEDAAHVLEAGGPAEMREV